MHFSYQSEKFSQARSALMLPHSQGEAESIAEAFHACSLALHRFDRSSLDEGASEWLRKLDALMDTTGVSASPGEGLWHAKAIHFSTDDKIEISRLVDELAHWFASHE